MISSTMPPTGRESSPSPACHKSFSRLTLIARHPSLPRRNEIFLIDEFFTAADTLPPAPPNIPRPSVVRNARQEEKDQQDAGCVMAFLNLTMIRRKGICYIVNQRGHVTKYCFFYLNFSYCVL